MDYYGLLFLYYLKGLSGKSILRLFFNIEVGGTEQLLPENTSTPTTTPILADIQYPDGLRTDQYFTYRETPTTVSNKARIKTIKGQTLKWNQLIASNETVNLNRDSARTYNISTNNTRSVVGHKYYFATTITSDNTNGGLNCRFGSDFNVGKGVGRHFITFTANDANNASIYCYIQSNEESGTALSFGDSVLFDLTLMGLADKTDDEIKQWFADYYPLPYYDYNAGSLLSFNGTGLKAVGKNLIDPSLIEYQKNWEGSANTSRAVCYLSLPYGTYTFSIQDMGTLAEVSVSVTAEKYGQRYSLGNLTNSNKSRTVTINADRPYAQFLLRAASGTITQTDFESCHLMIESGSTATDYESYTESVINLPISTYFPTGMKQAGDVYDELTPVKAITRMGNVVVDGSNDGLGVRALTNVMRVEIPFATAQYNSNQISNNLPHLVSYTSDTEHFYISNTYINLFIEKTKCGTTLASVQEYLSSTPTIIYYELATYIETPIESATEDANEALSLLMGRSVSSSNAKQMIDIITKGE